MHPHTALWLVLCASAAPAQLPWTWSRLSPLASPSARGAHAMVYDSARQRVVLFGGTANGTTPLADTWEWDGRAWTRMQPPVCPPGRWHHAMAFDAGRGRTVLFGGYSGHLPPTPLGDTWEWDGTTWVRCLPALNPPPRLRHSLEYDPISRRTILLGGDDVNTHRTGTWLWDGSNWQLSPAPSPPARSAAGLSFEPLSRRMVLFGGHLATPAQPQSDTWEWNGAAWFLRLTATAPSPRAAHAMAAHPRQGSVVVFGGDAYGTLNNETWELTAEGWSQILTTGPSPRRWHALVYQEGRGSWLFFGGDVGPGNVWQNDTWELSPGSFTTVGQGCAGSFGVPHLWSELPPRIGYRFDVHLTNVPAPLVGVMLVGPSIVPPLDLAGSGMPGCLLHVFPLWPSVLGQPPFEWSRAIPNSPALVGSIWFLQAVVYDPPANVAGLITSDAARAVIGF